MKASSQEKNLEALIVIAAGFILFYYIFKIDFILAVAFVILLIALFLKKISEYIVKAWFKLAEFLGFINSRILLLIVFYIFLTPIAFLKKILGTKNKTTLTNSNYIEINKTYTPKDMENTW